MVEKTSFMERLWNGEDGEAHQWREWSVVGAVPALGRARLERAESKSAEREDSSWQELDDVLGEILNSQF